MKYDITSVGSATRDVFLSLDNLPIIKSSESATGEAIALGLGSKLEIKKMVFASGGGATNTAVTFARQGLSAACISVIGQDFNGDEILKELKDEGVDGQYIVRHSDDNTAYSVILVSPEGERTILSYKGEGQHFEAAQIPFDRLETKWLFLDSLGGNFELLDRAVRWAAEHDVKLATNPGSRELAHGLEKLRPLLKYFSIVSMNQEEAAELSGIDYKNEKEIFTFMDDLIGGIFVMTKGKAGVSVSDGKHIYSAGVPDSPIIERTGSGDAFVSGFIAEYVISNDISKAIQMATANASSVVTKFGAKAGILKKGDQGPWPLVEVSVQ